MHRPGWRDGPGSPSEPAAQFSQDRQDAEWERLRGQAHGQGDKAAQGPVRVTGMAGSAPTGGPSVCRSWWLRGPVDSLGQWFSTGAICDFWRHFCIFKNGSIIDLPYCANFCCTAVTQSSIYIHTFFFKNTLFHPGLSQEPGYGSLCCAAGLHCLPILNARVCICQPQTRSWRHSGGYNRGALLASVAVRHATCTGQLQQRHLSPQVPVRGRPCLGAVGGCTVALEVAGGASSLTGSCPLWRQWPEWGPPRSSVPGLPRPRQCRGHCHWSSGRGGLCRHTTYWAGWWPPQRWWPYRGAGSPRRR